MLAESDARVRDYLDDRLQARADLDTVDALLQSVHSQHGLLQKQVLMPCPSVRLSRPFD
jgi:RAD50-interacting protein 1